MRTILLATAIVLTTLPGPAAGVEQAILGKRMLVKDPIGAEEQRKVIVFAKETATDIGAFSDPTSGGATLQIVTTGGMPSNVTYTLHPVGWSATGSGYTYSGPIAGEPVRRVTLRRTPGGLATLKVIVDGNSGTASLDVEPADPGDEGHAILNVSGGDRYCVSFGGAAGGIEGRDTAALWKITNATAEPGCPAALLPGCSSEFTPCGVCGDGICVQHPEGGPALVCASQGASTGGACTSNAECTAPQECRGDPGPPCMVPGRCMLPCASDATCGTPGTDFCGDVFCLGGPACFVACP